LLPHTKERYKLLCVNTLDNLDGKDTFLRKHKLPALTQEETECE
jgi:hypothetical protein